MSYNNKKFLDANGVTQIVGLLDDYATNETLSAVVNSVQTALDQKVDDVQINGSSVLNNGIANVPIAGDSLGVVKAVASKGIYKESDGSLVLSSPNDTQLKNLNNGYYAVKLDNIHKAAFYGLAKVAGADMAQSSNAVGAYTDAAKQGIQKLFGFEDILGNYESSTTASKAYTVGETFIFNGKRYRVTADIAQNYVITPGTNCELDPLDGKYVRKTDISDGLQVVNGLIKTNSASSSTVKNGVNSYAPIVPGHQHQSVFFGLAKAAGVDEASSELPFGTYTSQAKTAILTMLGAVGKTDIAGSTGENKGIAYFNGNYGVAINSETGGVYLSKPSDDVIKAGANDYKPIVPSIQHKSVFYALSKLAGVDLASGSDTVGTYPQTAKTAIQTMLGVSTGAILIENITGTTPTITALPNVRYKCGEVSVLTITPPASGSCEIIFSSGSTATTLTVPNTVKWPAWFDATALETNKIYDIIITDATYGAVMSWAS